MSKKTIIYLLIGVFILALISFVIWKKFEDKPMLVKDGQEEIIPDPVPEPIEQVSCLKGQFRHRVERGESLAFEVRLADEDATTTNANLAPLPRGVSGTLKLIEPGLGRVELNIGKNVEPADYSLVIIIEEGTEERAEKLCQFNLIIN